MNSSVARFCAAIALSLLSFAGVARAATYINLTLNLQRVDFYEQHYVTEHFLYEYEIRCYNSGYYYYFPQTWTETSSYSAYGGGVFLLPGQSVNYEPISYTVDPFWFWIGGGSNAYEDCFEYEDYWITLEEDVTVRALTIVNIGAPDGADKKAVMSRFSGKGNAGTGDSIMIGGFVLSGSGSDNVLLRGVGPGLGVGGAMANPVAEALKLQQGNWVSVGSNDNWGFAPNAASSLAASVGAPSLTNGSLDAAMVASLNGGIYSMFVSGAGGGAGLAQADIYDGVTSSSTLQLLNGSARCRVTSQNAVEAVFQLKTAGSGNSFRRVLIRGIGPRLSDLGLGGTVPDPLLILQDATTGEEIWRNDDWSGAPNAGDIAGAAASAGAFSLNSGSKDSAMLLHLPNKSYKAILATNTGATGIGLLEVYLVD